MTASRGIGKGNWKRPPFEDRFWARVEKTEGCWLWQGKVDREGYGLLSRPVQIGENRVWKAHRAAYCLVVGPIPDGLQLDHVRSRGCVHRHCVNPAHLEPVTSLTNVRRTHGVAEPFGEDKCLHGHALSADNLYQAKSGTRRCRKCMQAWDHKHGKRSHHKKVA